MAAKRQNLELTGVRLKGYYQYDNGNDYREWIITRGWPAAVSRQQAELGQATVDGRGGNRTSKSGGDSTFEIEVNEPIIASTDEGAIFELLCDVGCRMPPRERGRER